VNTTIAWTEEGQKGDFIRLAILSNRCDRALVPKK